MVNTLGRASRASIQLFGVDGRVAGVALARHFKLRDSTTTTTTTTAIMMIIIMYC